MKTTEKASIYTKYHNFGKKDKASGVKWVRYGNFDRGRGSAYVIMHKSNSYKRTINKQVAPKKIVKNKTLTSRS